jgi:hypothetical protein
MWFFELLILLQGINTFNGSKFDYYEFVKTLNRLRNKSGNLKQTNQLVLNDGSILKAVVGKIECFDISKYIGGTSKQALQELKCNVQKCYFDYSVWANRLYSNCAWPMYLQNAEQETFFRPSIYGSRTVKYKHYFTNFSERCIFAGLPLIWRYWRF